MHRTPPYALIPDMVHYLFVSLYLPIIFPPPLPFLWELSNFITFIALTRGCIISQGLLGSELDTNWDSSVPQAASTVRRGEGTCAALVGFLLVLNLITTQSRPPICL